MYTPRFVSQFDGSRLQRANCTMAAGAMLLDKQTGGRVRVSGGDLRAAQADQDNGPGDRPGTTLGALGSAFRSYGQDLHRASLPTVAALRSVCMSGQGVVLQGSYARFSLAYRIQKSFTGGHSLYVDHAVTQPDGVWYWRMDPLGRSPYQGDYVPERELARFGWCLGFWGSAAVAGPSTGGDAKPTPAPGTNWQSLNGMVGKQETDVFTLADWQKIMDLYRTVAGVKNPEALFGNDLKGYIGKTFREIPYNGGGMTGFDPGRDIPKAVTDALGAVTAFAQELLKGAGVMAFTGAGAIAGLVFIVKALERLTATEEGP